MSYLKRRIVYINTAIFEAYELKLLLGYAVYMSYLKRGIINSMNAIRYAKNKVARTMLYTNIYYECSSVPKEDRPSRIMHYTVILAKAS